MRLFHRGVCMFVQALRGKFMTFIKAAFFRIIRIKKSIKSEYN